MLYMINKTCLIFISVLWISCSNSTPNNPEKEILSVVNTDAVADTFSIEVPEEIEPLLPTLNRHELTEDDLYTDYDGGKQLAEFFVIELIDKGTFLRNKSLAVTYLQSDTLEINKRDGILRLPSENGEISFVDNLTGEESHKEYSYIGRIDKLNVYVMSGIYWEDWNYFFVDKVTGKTIQTFASQPYLSADLRYIVSVDIDTFEGSTYIDLYEVVDNNVDPLVGMYVKKWIPIDNYEKMYWANDNYLYIAVVHNADFWGANGNFSGLEQYIRLKPLA